jgi:hypothetical protein
MNRLVVGILCGVVFGLIDVLMTVFGKHSDVSRTMLLQALFQSLFRRNSGRNRYAALHPILVGAIVSLLISLPDALGLNSYVGGPGDRPALRRADGGGCQDVGNLAYGFPWVA